MISRVIQSFQLQLPVKALFEAPTVAQMALVISQSLKKNANETELARMLDEVEAMSDRDAEKQLSSLRGQSI